MGCSRYERERETMLTVLSVSRMRPEHKRWWEGEEHLALWPLNIVMSCVPTGCARAGVGGGGRVVHRQAGEEEHRAAAGSVGRKGGGYLPPKSLIQLDRA